MSVRYVCVLDDGGHSYWRGAKCPTCGLPIRFREDAVVTSREIYAEIDAASDPAETYLSTAPSGSS